MPIPLRALVLFVVAMLAACAAPPPTLERVAIPPATRQVVLVTNEHWAATDARLQRFERDGGGGWRQVGGPVAVTVGRSGFGWGLGLHRDGEGPIKNEGDGRAPAGVFELGTAFGYAADAPAGCRVAYRAAGERDYFVDDAGSTDYNRWRRIPDGEANDPKARWQSCERMRRDDHQYEFGMVVEHNDACVPGRGSAIFLHVWQQPGAPTSGCTAMARSDLLALLRWLDPTARPLLVQAPRGVVAEVGIAEVGVAGEGR
ncbi:MAG: L,D-transpeptidase [Planctomycetota bacterium]